MCWYCSSTAEVINGCGSRIKDYASGMHRPLSLAMLRARDRAYSSQACNFVPSLASELVLKMQKAIVDSYDAQSTSKQGPSQICLVGSLAYHAPPYARATMIYYIEQLFPHTGHIRPHPATILYTQYRRSQRDARGTTWVWELIPAHKRQHVHCTL